MVVPKIHESEYRFCLNKIAACPLAFGEIGVKERMKLVMNYKKPAFWMIVAAVITILIAAVCLLTNPTGENNFLKIKHDISGKVIETNVDAEIGLSSFVIQTDDNKEIGIRMTDETHCFSFVEGMSSETFLSSPQTDVLVSVKCYRSHESLMTDEGKKITAYNAERIIVDGYLKNDIITLSDGTDVDLWQYSNAAAYALRNGTELLRVQTPSGPDHAYVVGVESLDDIDAGAKNNILEFYRDRGLLYDEKAELEKAYAHYLASDEPSEFDSYSIGQETAPSASTDTVIYFLTTVSLPIDGSHDYELRIGTAFHKSTGEPIDSWDLFSCSPDEALETIMDIAGVSDPVLKAEMKRAFYPENLIFFQDNLEVCFRQGSLPSQEYTYILGLDYDDRLAEILHDWAIPRSNN